MRFKPFNSFFLGFLYACQKYELNLIKSNFTSSTAFNLSKMSPNKRLSPNDPNSFSNPEAIRAEHLHLSWNIDFTRKVISGKVAYNLTALNPSVENIVLDTRELKIKGASTVDGKPLKFKLGEAVLNFGQPLTVNIADLVASSKSSKNPIRIEVEYETSPKSSALQWLEAEQTAGKQHPYLFSQCEMIHSRSLLPCQDTPFAKATYTADVTVPKELQALMSAIVSNKSVEKGDLKTYTFDQKIVIPAYLIAIAVGDIKGKKVGPRTTIWSEPELLEASAYEFSETEEMIQAAEKLMGEYVWGIYDILVLPPSFPMGGMENPTLTFATPTTLAGDRSLANIIAHEISHSWTGNLVTNKNFEHFWLNEGFTVFAERKILGMMKGESYRQFECIGGWKCLTDTVNTLKAGPMTSLVTNLTGEDPDEHFSLVPYEKGSVFLYYLEEKVGGSAVFEPFFKSYIQSHRFMSIDTETFQNFFNNYFKELGLSDLIKDIDWDTWLFNPGMPIYKPNYDTTLTDACTNLKNQWLEWDMMGCSPFSKKDFENFFSNQIVEFLAQILDEKSTLELEKVKAMEEAYNFNSYKNSEIRFRWLRLCIRAKWVEQVDLALEFVTEQGRMKYVRPLYREMYNWDEIRPRAVANFLETRPSMMSMSANLIAKDMHL